MTPERWNELNRLFHSALQWEPGERSALLDKECAGDAGLRREVEALLTAHEDAGSFIERAALEVEARAMAADHDQLSLGHSISHYKILSQLGAGGMGEVYLAEDTALGRKVALKLLPEEFSCDLDRVHRFQQEAHAASALNHPNIVTIHEIAHIDDRYLIATEFIEGETLREQIGGVRPPTTTEGDGDKSGGGLPLREVLHIGIQIADALSAAHEAGIVHRDIKPENIMVRRRDGYIKVLDFGLAKLSEPAALAGGRNVDTEAVTRAQVKTSAGLVMGTVTYMSPEQTRGEKVDPRTDIWSLGVVLYELVAGRAPFERPTPSEIIAAILDREPAPLTQYVREVSAEFDRIISKALTKDKEQRYQTVKEFLNDLRRLQYDVGTGSKLDLSVLSESVESQAARNTHHTVRTGTSAHRPNRRQLSLVMMIVAAAVVVSVAASLIYRSYSRARAKAIESIVVLPLLNNEPNTEYLSDGISETLIDSLSELDQLRVTARATAFHYKNKDVDPQAVGRELDVRALLMGRLRQQGDTLNIHVDLVDTATGAQLWGREYEGKVSDALSLKQLIAHEVTGKLRPQLSGEQQQKLNKGDTTNPEAYQSYMRGHYFWKQRTADGIKKAIAEFQQAINLDRNYALAYVGIADSYLLLEQYGGTPANETLPRARAAVHRALAIDDSLAEAHTSLAMIERFSWNYDAAEKEFKRAIVLNPNYATAHHWYSLVLRDVRGRFDDALAEIKIAQRLDPLSSGVGATVAGTLFVTGEQDAAFQEAKKIIELDPKLPIGHWTLGILYLSAGRYEEAIAEEEKAVEFSERASLYVSELGVCYAAAGYRAKALELLKEVEERYNRHEAVGLYVASVYAALGDRDQAFAWLEKDFQAHSGRLPQIVHFPIRENLRTDARFQDLLRRMGLPQN